MRGGGTKQNKTIVHLNINGGGGGGGGGGKKEKKRRKDRIFIIKYTTFIQSEENI